MIKMLILFSLLLTGCFSEWLLPADLKPEGPDGWADEVAQAADAWNTALGAPCDGVFSIGDTYPIKLVPAADWPWGESIGITDTGGLDWRHGSIHDAEIEVRDDSPSYQRVLLHELGHALGLEHSASGIMNANTLDNEIDDDAIKLARGLLGC